MRLRWFSHKSKEASEKDRHTAELHEVIRQERVLLDDLASFRAQHAYRVKAEVRNPLYR